MRRHRMGRIYLLCAWVCLPRGQPLVLPVHSWPCPDTGAAGDSTAGDSDDDNTFSDDDNQHANNAG